MTAVGLKEYELQYAGFNSRSDLGFIVGRVAKPLAPQMSEVTQSVPGKYGNIYTGTNYESLVFNIPITILADDAGEYNRKIENIRSVFINLYEDKNKEYPLIFGDRPEVMYYGHWTSLPDPQFITENDWDTQTTLQFTCSEPYGYMDTEVISLTDNNEAIYPKGTGYTYPVYVMKLKKDVFNIGYADQNSSQYVATGYTVDIDNTDESGNKISNKEPLVVNEPETDLSSWSTDDSLTHAINIDNGDIDGELDVYGGWGIAPKKTTESGLNADAQKITKEVFNFGTAKNHKNWYGPMAVHQNVPNPTSDWQMSVTLRHAQQYQRAMGKIEIYLLDENNQRRGKIWIKDQSHGRIPHLGIQLGTNKKGNMVEILKKDKTDGSDDSSNDYVGPQKIPGTDIDWINSSSGKETVTLKYTVKKKVAVKNKTTTSNTSTTKAKKTTVTTSKASPVSKGTTKTDKRVVLNHDGKGNYTSTSVIENKKDGTKITTTTYPSGKQTITTIKPDGTRTVEKRSVSDKLKRRILKRGLNPDDLETRKKSTQKLYKVDTTELEKEVKSAVNQQTMTSMNSIFDQTYGSNTATFDVDPNNPVVTFDVSQASALQTETQNVEYKKTAQKTGGVKASEKVKAQPVSDSGELQKGYHWKEETQTKTHTEWYWADKHSAFTNFCGTFFLRKVGNHFSCWLQMKENEYGMPAGGVMAKRDFYDDDNVFQFDLTSIGAWISKYNIDDDTYDPPYPYDDNKLAIEGFQYWNILDGGNQDSDDKKIIAQSGETIYIDTNQMKVYKSDGTDLTKYTSFASSFPPLRGGVYNQLAFEPRPGTDADIYIQYRPRIK